MQLKPTITYGVSMSSVSRRKRHNSNGRFKKIVTALVVIMFIFACIGFFKFGVLDFFSTSERATSCILSGDELMAIGDYEGALKEYTKAFEIEDTNADALAAKGDAYTALNKYGDAEQAYAESIKLSNKCERAYRGYINLYIEKGVASDARLWLKKAKNNGIKFKDNEWSVLSSKVPQKMNLAVADKDISLSEGSIRVTDNEVIYTDKATKSDKVIYTGSPAIKFASNGVSVYIYDNGTNQIVLSDVASGLSYKIADVYTSVDSSSKYYSKGRFCGCAGDFLYFSEQSSEEKFVTYVLNTENNSFAIMDKVDIKSIIYNDKKLYYISNNSGLFSCEYDGQNLIEICAEIKDKDIFDNVIIYTEPVEEYRVNVWRYNMDNGETECVADGLNMHSVIAIYEGFMTYYSIDDNTQETKIETLEFE